METDFDFDECEAPTRPTNNMFFGKIYYNLLKTWQGKHGDESFLRALIEYPDSIRGPWLEFFSQREKDYRASKPDVKYSFISDFLTPLDVAHFADMVLEACPWVADDWALHQNTLVLADLLDLSPHESLVLNAALELPYSTGHVRHVLAPLEYGDENKAPEKFYARIFNMTEADARKMMKGFLFRSGFLVPSDHPKCFHFINEEMSETLNNSVRFTRDTIEDYLFPSNIATELTPQSYPHLKKEIKICEDVVNKGLADRSTGINLLFWGVPGTGKTELALAMAKANGWSLKTVGDISDTDTNEKSRAQRITSLKIALKLFARSENTVLLFDEMEDLFKDEKDQNYSKAFINRFIETTKVPIIWTTNNLHSLGAAVLRRMVYNIGFQVPPVSARNIIWRSYNTKYDLGLADDVLTGLADDYDMVPALINNAAKITKLSGLSVAEIPDVLTSLDTLVNFGEKRSFAKSILADTPYDMSCANADVDLEKLTHQLSKAKPRFSLCLYGPPGTGKSEWARHVAKQMGKKVLFKRVSDLQDMYVGECEKKIAAAFAEAAENQKVLIIDEGDSFLRSRQKAERSWEVSQVNEMLSQMEEHTQPFIITTNLIKELDEASLRRFTFKVAFDFMKPLQAKKLFVLYFKKEPPLRINANHLLTPGDFANVRRRADILHVTHGDEIYEMLEAECDLKPQKGADIGFKNLVRN